LSVLSAKIIVKKEGNWWILVLVVMRTQLALPNFIATPAILTERQSQW
jgi:hypothetical protein